MIEAGLAACGVRIVIKIIVHKLESSPLGLDFFFMLLVESVWSVYSQIKLAIKDFRTKVINLHTTFFKNNRRINHQERRIQNMAYTAIYANGSTFNMVKKFVIDSFNEIYDIDTSQLSPGSIVLDISSSKKYMLNNEKQWIEVQMGTGGGSGGASIELDTTLTQSGKAADAKAVGDALAEKQPTGDYLTQDNLQSATNAALEQAKASGEFDGDPGVVISTTQPTSDNHPVWINPEGIADQYLELRGNFMPIVKTAMDDVAQAGVMYCLGEQTAVSITLPDNAEAGQEIAVVWYNGAAAATLSITGTMLPCDYAPSANSRSEINALWDGRYWSVLTAESAVDA